MWRIAGLLIVVATTLALPGQAKAICRIHTPDVAYDNAGVIFSGRVIDRRSEQAATVEHDDVS